MASKRYWLKMIGAADWKLENFWIAQRPDLVTEVRTPKTATSISAGDLLVYYAAGVQKLFAIARSTMNGAEAEISHAEGLERWPYVLRIQMMLAIPSLALAPDWRVLGMDSGSVQQKSYVEINQATYSLAWQAITDRTRA